VAVETTPGCVALATGATPLIAGVNSVSGVSGAPDPLGGPGLTAASLEARDLLKVL